MAAFKVGDRLVINGVPPGLLDVIVTGVGICDDDDCGKPTVCFLDPESGEPDEAHAEDFTLAVET